MLSQAGSGSSGDPIEEKTKQFLTFILEGEEYGLDILEVREIRGWDDATPIPNAPAFLKGVINLRGIIVPIVDLRVRFNRPPDPSITPVVIVVELKSPGRLKVVGLMVDAVSDVYTVLERDIKPAPDLGKQLIADFIYGLVTVSERMIILLKLDKLLPPEEIQEAPESLPEV